MPSFYIISGRVKRTYCSVVGGNLLEVLEKKQNYLPSIQNLRGIFVQGRKMAETLKNQYRIPNAVYVPNAKPYYAITPATCAPAASVLQFVFLSRLHPDKGIDLILRCAERLDREGFGNKFRIDFYGKPATSDYEQEFLSFRYFGKTYANLQEALYFNGHWETFGGINWNVNKKLSLGVSVINIFNEKGAKGTISGSGRLN